MHTAFPYFLTLHRYNPALAVGGLQLKKRVSKRNLALQFQNIYVKKKKLLNLFLYTQPIYCYHTRTVLALNAVDSTNRNLLMLKRKGLRRCY